MKRFSASAACVFISRVLAFVSVFGFNAILARKLNPTEFGIFALLFSIAMLTCMTASLGMNRALVMVLASTQYKRGRENVRRMIAIGTWSSVLGGLVAAILAWIGVMAFLPEVESSSRNAVALMFAGIVLVRNIHFVLAETARGFHETNWSNLFGGSPGGPLPHLLFLIAVSCFGVTSIGGVLAVYLACFLITLPPLVFKLYSMDLPEDRRKPKASTRPTSKPINPTNVWGLAIPIMLTQAFGLTITQADIWLAGGMLLPASIAIYFAGQKMIALLTIPLQISGTALVSFVPELLSKDSKQELQELVGVATLVSGISTILIGAILFFFPEAVLTLVYGGFYASAAIVLQVLVVGQLVCVLAGPCEMVLMMAGHQKKTFYVNIACAIAIATICPLAILHFGITGLALGMGTVTIGQNLVNNWLVRRLVGIDTRFSFSYLPALKLKLTGQFAILTTPAKIGT